MGDGCATLDSRHSSVDNQRKHRNNESIAQHTLFPNKVMISSVNILYAPLPDESTGVSASLEFAKRGQEYLQKQARSHGQPTVAVHVNPLMEESVQEFYQLQQSPQSNGTLFILLLSCGRDGSVHRVVRKVTKKLQTSITNQPLPDGCGYALALLGHSICKTSAEQMNEQVFATGRRLVKTLRSALPRERPSTDGTDANTDNDDGSSSRIANETTPSVFVLETQVELTSPEDSFDPWLQTLARAYLDGGT